MSKNFCFGFLGIWITSSFALHATAACSDIQEVPLSPREWGAIKDLEARRIRVVETVRPSVVAIFPRTRQGGGSGVLIDGNGFALTNNHVVQPVGGEGLGGLADGVLYKLTVIATDPGGDIALVRLHGKDRFPYSPLGDSDLVRTGDGVLAMGNPFTLAEDLRPTVTFGIVSGINRYQGGQNNVGIYGNCLQFDTSINPGNSGGPLFTLAGQVAGINGRGSFEERGRVNVGLGYAISINQVKRFLPDLFATKVCLHGTLDASFGDRQGQVICEKIHTDSVIAKLGLGLGDRLLAFDGVPIESANQFGNLVSTYPAHWPVDVSFEHEGQTKTVRLRLPPLTYTAPNRPPPVRGGPRERGGDKEGEKPPVRPAKPGEIGKPELNREECKRILTRWRSFVKPGVEEKASQERAKGVRSAEECRSGGRLAGRVLTVLAFDGRFRVEWQPAGQAGPEERPGQTKEPGPLIAAGWDGKRHWQSPKDNSEPPSGRPGVDLLASLFPLQAVPLNPRDEKVFQETVLEGGDRAQGKIAGRMRLTHHSGKKYMAWFSFFPETESPEPWENRLLKAALAEGQPDPEAGWIFSDFRLQSGWRWPHRRALVQGLGEEPVWELQTVSLEWMDALHEDLFKEKADAAK